MVPASWWKLTLDFERRWSRNSLDAMSEAARIDYRRRSLTTRGLLCVAYGLVAALIWDACVAKHRQVVSLVIDISAGGCRPCRGPWSSAIKACGHLAGWVVPPSAALDPSANGRCRPGRHHDEPGMPGAIGRPPGRSRPCGRTWSRPRDAARRSGPGRVALPPTAQRAVATGRGAAWSAHLLWEQGVAGSNPAVPTTSTNPLLSRGADGPSLG